MEQLYVVRVNQSLIQQKRDLEAIKRFQKANETRGLTSSEEQDVLTIRARVEAYESAPKVFVCHSGGKGNGAVGGLYTKKQINRILGRYTEGNAEALPVSIGLTQEASDSNAEDAHFLRCLESAGVDNWDGFDYAREQYQEEGGGSDD